MRMNRQTIGRQILWGLAALGVTELVGIPFVGRIVAGMLDGIAFGASKTADYIRYTNAQEANQIIQHQLNQGARLDKFYHNDDGSIAVRYDVSAYTGENIGADTIEALSSDWI